jgi:death-on-curing protein
MLFLPDSDLIKVFHFFLSYIYEESEDPTERITQGYVNEGVIQGCIDGATRTNLMGRTLPQRDIYSMAAYLCKSLIELHPFIDGNKRTALLSAYYFLLWNGYEFIIGDDSVDFTVRIADTNIDVPFSEVYHWIQKNTKRTFWTRIRYAFLYFSARVLKSPLFIESIAFAHFPPFIREVMRRQRK